MSTEDAPNELQAGFAAGPLTTFRPVPAMATQDGTQGARVYCWDPPGDVEPSVETRAQMRGFQ